MFRLGLFNFDDALGMSTGLDFSGYNAPGAGYGAPPAPSYNAPAPSYNAPAPSYNAPAPSYNAPAPSYSAPAPSYNAPAPVQQPPPRPSYNNNGIGLTSTGTVPGSSSASEQYNSGAYFLAKDDNEVKYKMFKENQRKKSTSYLLQ